MIAKVLVVLGLILFILALFGVTVGDLNEIRELALGGSLLAVAMLL